MPSCEACGASLRMSGEIVRGSCTKCAISKRAENFRKPTAQGPLPAFVEAEGDDPPLPMIGCGHGRINAGLCPHCNGTNDLKTSRCCGAIIVERKGVAYPFCSSCEREALEGSK